MTVVRMTMMATRTAMIALYGVSKSCVDLNSPCEYNNIYQINSYLSLEAESYLMIYMKSVDPSS